MHSHSVRGRGFIDRRPHSNTHAFKTRYCIFIANNAFFPTRPPSLSRSLRSRLSRLLPSNVFSASTPPIVSSNASTPPVLTVSNCILDSLVWFLRLSLSVSLLIVSSNVHLLFHLLFIASVNLNPSFWQITYYLNHFFNLQSSLFFFLHPIPT